MGRFSRGDGQHIEVAVCAKAAEDCGTVQVGASQHVAERVMEDGDDLLDMTTIGLGEAVRQVGSGRGSPRFRSQVRDRMRGTARGRTRSALEANR